MALDEALLRTPGPPTLRLYGWSPPGLSLGYFQAASSFSAVPGDHVMVRRLTGGGAIYHADEITFAITADASLLPRNVTASYELIHGAVAAALERVGVAAVVAGPGPRGNRPRAPATWCFQDASGADLLTPGGSKILGSAQRRLGRPLPRILHHGSLLVSKPPLKGALVEELSVALGLCPKTGEATEQEDALADVLSAERYRNPQFTCRR